MDEMRRESLEALKKKRIQKAKKKRLKNIISLILVLALILSLVFIIKSCSSEIEKNGTFVEFEISEGETAGVIARNLEEAGLVKSSKKFLKALNKSEYANSLRFGVYNIEMGSDNKEIIEILAKGGSLKNSVIVTIPEGFSVERIIERLVESGVSNTSDLKKAANDDYNYDFLKLVPESDSIKYKVQGFLFPSTYEFSKDMEATEVIDRMLKEFDKRIKNEGISKADLYRTITLASLVEREAKVKSEQKTIAGVIENRIKQGMRLQIDASVVYAISDGMYNVERVLYKDLEVDSPYNTYKYTGLPVGPICSPGIEAIKAASNPERHGFYYYRVDSSKNDGSHIFTENYDEHLSVG